MKLMVEISMCGITNNGNIDRRVFQQPNITAQIAGVSESIIHRFSVVLTAKAISMISHGLVYL